MPVFVVNGENITANSMEEAIEIYDRQQQQPPPPSPPAQRPVAKEPDDPLWGLSKDQWKAIAGVGGAVSTALGMVPGPVGVASRAARIGIPLISGGVAAATTDTPGGAIASWVPNIPLFKGGGSALEKVLRNVLPGVVDAIIPASLKQLIDQDRIDPEQVGMAGALGGVFGGLGRAAQNIGPTKRQQYNERVKPILEKYEKKVNELKGKFTQQTKEMEGLNKEKEELELLKRQIAGTRPEDKLDPDQFGLALDELRENQRRLGNLKYTKRLAETVSEAKKKLSVKTPPAQADPVELIEGADQKLRSLTQRIAGKKQLDQPDLTKLPKVSEKARDVLESEMENIANSLNEYDDLMDAIRSAKLTAAEIKEAGKKVKEIKKGIDSSVKKIIKQYGVKPDEKVGDRAVSDVVGDLIGETLAKASGGPVAATGTSTASDAVERIINAANAAKIPEMRKLTPREVNRRFKEEYQRLTDTLDKYDNLMESIAKKKMVEAERKDTINQLRVVKNEIESSIKALMKQYGIDPDDDLGKKMTGEIIGDLMGGTLSKWSGMTGNIPVAGALRGGSWLARSALRSGDIGERVLRSTGRGTGRILAYPTVKGIGLSTEAKEEELKRVEEEQPQTRIKKRKIQINPDDF